MISNKNIFHTALANYFSSQPHFFYGEQKQPHIRKLVEQPFQQTKAEMWDEVTDTLCNLDFIQAKCSAGISYDLVTDFNSVFESIPDNTENICKEKERQVKLDRYANDLVLYSKGEINELELPESIPPLSEEEIYAEIARIKTNPSRADILMDFYNFLGNEVHNLQKHAHEIPHLATQQAWNFVDSGPVGEASGKKPNEVLNRLLLRISSTRPSWNPFPQALKTFKGHTECLAISLDGKFALSGSDKSCILWDLESQMPRKTLEGHTKRVTSLAITPGGKNALSGSIDGTLIHWDLESGKLIKILKGHTNMVEAIAITPDGKMALSGSWDNTCIQWDLTTGLPHKIIEDHIVAKIPKETRNEYHRPVHAVAISPDGKIALYSSNDDLILMDIESGTIIGTLNGHSKTVTSVSTSPDFKIALSGSRDNTCILWNLKTGQLIKTLESPNVDEEINAVAMTPDGKMAITGSGSLLISDFKRHSTILWDLESGQHLKILNGHTDHVHAVGIRPDGKTAISGSKDGTYILWNLEKSLQSNIQQKHSGLVSSVAISPDGKMALSGSWDKTCVLWDIESGKPDITINEFNEKVTAVAFTPVGNRFLSGSWDKSLIFKDLKSGRLVYSLTGHINIVTAVAVSPDGKKAISTSYDKTGILWDLESGNPLNLYKGHNDIVWSVAISPDGKMALTGSMDHTCILWNLESGIILNILKGHSESVQAVAFTPDGRSVISGGRDRTCIVWDLEMGTASKILKGHDSSVSSIAISPDGKMALAGTADGSCFLWDIEEGKKLAQFITASMVWSITMFSRGIIIGSDSGETLIIQAHREIICPGPGIITARHIWDFENIQFQALSADCPFCGNRFSPPEAVLDTIKEITIEEELTPEQSPCLYLSSFLFRRPGLLSVCPQCGEDLRFNPFIAESSVMDREDLGRLAKKWWQFRK